MISQDNTYFISIEKQIIDTTSLVEEIKKSNWIDRDTIIVNCYPDYSSITTQLINHKLCYLNHNELFETISLELPYKSMNQIWNKRIFNFQIFDKYLVDWIALNVNKEHKYLFIRFL